MQRTIHAKLFFTIIIILIGAIQSLIGPFHLASSSFLLVQSEKIHSRGKYHCTAGLQLNLIGFDQRRKYLVICKYWISWIQANETGDQLYSVQWYFPQRWVFSDSIYKDFDQSKIGAFVVSPFRLKINSRLFVNLLNLRTNSTKSLVNFWTK